MEYINSKNNTIVKQTKLFLSLLMLFALSIGNVWGEKITDYTQLVSGQEYYIGATISSTDYYLSFAKEDVGTGIQGTAITDNSTATKVTAIGNGTSWAFTLKYGAENEYPLCRQSDNWFGRRGYDRRLKGYSYTIYLLRLLGNCQAA